MTNEEIERELTHLATKLDVEALRTEMHRELRGLAWRLIVVMISIQIPTWTGIVGILLVLLNQHK